MRRLTLIIGLLGALACSQFDPKAAEDAILDIVYTETEKLPSSPITLEVNVPEEDSVRVDSNWITTRVKLTTSMEAESVVVSFNTEYKEDTVEILGDSAEVTLKRKYSGVMITTCKSLEDGGTRQVFHNFSTQRLQFARFLDDEGWNMTRYSMAEERSDTNTYRITHLKMAGVVDAEFYYPEATLPLDSFPLLQPGDELELELKTVADTAKLFCFAKGSQTVRFLPKADPEGEADDLWQTSVTLGSQPLVVGIIRKESLSDSTYPADFDVWLIPVEQ